MMRHPRRGSRRAFTLMEVLVSLMMATVGVVYLSEGISLATLSEQRQRFYERCSQFLEQQFEAVVVRLGNSAGGTDAGTVPGRGGDIVYEARAEPMQDLPGVTRVILTFTGNFRGTPQSARIVTYYYPRLLARKPEAS